MRLVDFIAGKRDFKVLLAQQFMQNKVFYHRVNDPGVMLAQEMTDGNFGSVPIVDQDHRVVGIVSEYDLLKALMEGKVLTEVTAGELMTSNPITVAPDTPAMDVIKILEDKHFIRLPVVDAEGKLLGIVARRNILQGYLKATFGFAKKSV